MDYNLHLHSSGLHKREVERKYKTFLLAKAKNWITVVSFFPCFDDISTFVGYLKPKTTL